LNVADNPNTLPSTLQWLKYNIFNNKSYNNYIDKNLNSKFDSNEEYFLIKELNDAENIENSDNLKKILERIQNSFVSFSELKTTVELENKDVISLKELVLEIKEIAKATAKHVTLMEEHKNRILWLFGSGIVTASVPALVELIKFLVTLFK
jgi:hypothetical protein